MKIDKVYKLFFVIYAPIAIITYLISFFKNIPLEYISYVFF